jgi:riboflavin-specific deaminase-like protein
VSGDFQRLVPGEELDARGYVEALSLPAPAPAQRPYVIVNFVASLDGHIVVEGRSAPLSDPGDRALFHALRERADAVLSGASTIGIERYGRMIPNAETRARRVATGRSPEPLAVTVTRSGKLPLDAPLFAEPEANVVVFTPTPPPLDGVAAQVSFEPYEADVKQPLTGALATLRQRHGVELVLCEGGPRLFGSLLEEGVVDELFLTISPNLVGGESGPALASGPPLPELAPVHLRSALVREDTLLLRYAITT